MTGALRIHLQAAAPRGAAFDMRSRVSSSRTTTKCQGCVLLEEGARRAASRIWSSWLSSTGFEVSKRRTLLRSRMIFMRGVSLVAEGVWGAVDDADGVAAFVVDLGAFDVFFSVMVGSLVGFVVLLL